MVPKEKSRAGDRVCHIDLFNIPQMFAGDF